MSKEIWYKCKKTCVWEIKNGVHMAECGEIWKGRPPLKRCPRCGRIIII